MILPLRLFCGFVILLILINFTFSHSVLWAINCGGDAHIDVNGVEYMADFLDVGTKSSHGMQLSIRRVLDQDKILYQTERYHVEDFSYKIPKPINGEYVLVLKFSEVWFKVINGKVFDVSLNGEAKIISDLDIFEKAGFATAHDEYIPFVVTDDVLYVGDKQLSLNGLNYISVDFLKGNEDNPKVNAIVLFKGTLNTVPTLPPLPDWSDQEFEIPELPEKIVRPRPVSGPSVPNPYSTVNASSYIIAIVVSLAAFFPLLFFMCRL